MQLLLLAIILLSVRLVVFIWLHIRYRAFSILRNTVSDYGVEASKKMYSVMGLLSLGAYTLIAAYLWMQNIKPEWLTIALTVAALGSAAILFFPTDKTNSGKKTRTGRVHWLLAIINFTLLFIFMINASVPSEGILLQAMTWVVRITFYAFLVTLFISTLRTKYIGLTERLFLTSTPLWFIVYCLSLLFIN
jgi:hypothetical protein